MLFLAAILLSVTFLFLSTNYAHAIIVIIPTILIPIVSIIVWVITAITAPVIGLSALYFKLRKKSVIRGMLFGIFLVLLTAVILFIVLKLIDPNRPIY